MDDVTLRIEGMSCGHCVARVQQALAALDGATVESVTVGEAHLKVDPSRLTAADLAKAVQAAGYRVAG